MAFEREKSAIAQPRTEKARRLLLTMLPCLPEYASDIAAYFAHRLSLSVDLSLSLSLSLLPVWEAADALLTAWLCKVAALLSSPTEHIRASKPLCYHFLHAQPAVAGPGRDVARSYTAAGATQEAAGRYCYLVRASRSRLYPW